MLLVEVVNDMILTSGRLVYTGGVPQRSGTDVHSAACL